MNNTVQRNINRSWVFRTYAHLRASSSLGDQLDEFPFASTSQGGESGPAEGRMVPGRQNSMQGGDLRWFYSRLGYARDFLVVPVAK